MLSTQIAQFRPVVFKHFTRRLVRSYLRSKDTSMDDLASINIFELLFLSMIISLERSWSWAMIQCLDVGVEALMTRFCSSILRPRFFS